MVGTDSKNKNSYNIPIIIVLNKLYVYIRFMYIVAFFSFFGGLHFIGAPSGHYPTNSFSISTQSRTQTKRRLTAHTHILYLSLSPSFSFSLQYEIQSCDWSSDVCSSDLFVFWVVLKWRKNLLGSDPMELDRKSVV